MFVLREKKLSDRAWNGEKPMMHLMVSPLCVVIPFTIIVVFSTDLADSVPWREAVNEDDNPEGLEDNTVMDDIEKANEAVHADKKEKNIFEGDIELTKSDREGVDTRNTNPAETAEVDVDSLVTKRKAISSRRHLWFKKVVPLELEATASEAWNNILAAVDEIQKKSCIRFRMKKKGDQNWIRFVKKNGCFSPVGRQYETKGAQFLSIGNGCNEKGIILHELLHALGFWHEQARSDRDDYIEVLWENIKKGQEHNFNRYTKKEMDYAGGVYDFSSIMHYGNYAFSKNKKPTMLSVKDPILQFGQIAAMSSTDVLQLNSMYDCQSDKSSGWSSWGNWGPCNTNCTKERERFCSADDMSKCPGADGDRVQVQKGKCPPGECYVPIHGHWGRWGPWSQCSVTCGQGYRTRSRTCDDPQPRYGGKYCEGPLVAVKSCMLNKTCGWRRKRTRIIIRKEKRQKRKSSKKPRKYLLSKRFVGTKQRPLNRRKLNARKSEYEFEKGEIYLRTAPNL